MLVSLETIMKNTHFHPFTYTQEGPGSPLPTLISESQPPSFSVSSRSSLDRPHGLPLIGILSCLAPAAYKPQAQNIQTISLPRNIPNHKPTNSSSLKLNCN